MKGFFFKQSTTNILLYYTRALIDAFNMLWLFPLILTTEQIGLHKMILSSTYLLVYFVQLGLPQSVMKYFPMFKKERKEFLGFIIISSSIIYLIFFGFCICLKRSLVYISNKRGAVLDEYFYLIFGTGYFLLLMMLLKSWYKSHLKSIFPNFIQNVLIFILISLSGILYYFRIISFNILIYSIFFMYFAGFLFMLLNLYLINELTISFKIKKFLKIRFLYEFLTYNFFSMIGNNGFSVITKIDALMISILVGLQGNGIYAIVISIAKIIEIPRKAIKQLSVPIFSIIINKKKYKKIDATYKDISLWQFIAAMFLILFIFSNIDSIMNLIPNKEIKESGKYITFFICVSKLIDSILSTGNDIILMSKFYWLNIIFILTLCILTVLTNFLFIPIWGIIGAAFATSLSYLIYNLIIFSFVYFKMGYNPFSKNIVTVFAIGFLIYYMSYFFPSLENDVLNILINLFLISIFYWPILYLLKVIPKFKDLSKYEYL